MRFRLPPRRPAVRPRPIPVPDPEGGDVIPGALRISASWAWRIGIVILVAGALVWLLSFVSLLVIPLMVAALLSSLLYPVNEWLTRHRVPSGLSVAITMVSFLTVIFGALALVGRQIVFGFSALWEQALEGVDKVQTWLSDGPLHLSTDQINSYISEVTDAIQNNSGTIVSGALSFGTTAGHIGTGVLLTLFSLIFLLRDGDRIWRFLVNLMPRRARPAVFGAGLRGWTSLVNYVRTQIVVAFVDAVGISIGAAVFGVPLVLPLGVLVFLGSFIPIVGALFTGMVVVLLALVANGWVNALIMLGVVLVVQQAESHILQPLLMGKAVSLHPLAVVLAVAGGTMVAGIPGALFSVPMLAIANAFVRYIAARAWEHDPEVLNVLAPEAAGAVGSGEAPGAERAARETAAAGENAAARETAAGQTTGHHAPTNDDGERAVRGAPTGDDGERSLRGSGTNTDPGTATRRSQRPVVVARATTHLPSTPTETEGSSSDASSRTTPESENQ